MYDGVLESNLAKAADALDNHADINKLYGADYLDIAPRPLKKIQQTAIFQLLNDLKDEPYFSNQDEYAKVLQAKFNQPTPTQNFQTGYNFPKDGSPGISQILNNLTALAQQCTSTASSHAQAWDPGES